MLLPQILLNGVLTGGLYGLMAFGMALVWGVLKILNLAHGSLIMLGGYMVYYLFTLFGLDPFAALPIAALFMFVFGYLLQRFLINLIVRATMLSTLLIAFGIDVIITYLAQLFFSADFRTINPAYSGANFSVLGLTVPVVGLAAFIIAVILAAAIWFVLNHTPLGRAIRATAQNLTAARLYGIAPVRIYAMTFGIGAALAGVAGGLFGLTTHLTPYIGAELTAKSFVIAIIGGLTNPFNVIFGGIAVGIAEQLGSFYLGATYSDVISFGLLVLVLVLRPVRSLRATLP
ncbi:MAG: branched-chain amino acid ABC transporter permease [Hyphomicrobiales bacterium]